MKIETKKRFYQSLTRADKILKHYMSEEFLSSHFQDSRKSKEFSSNFLKIQEYLQLTEVFPLFLFTNSLLKTLRNTPIFCNKSSLCDASSKTTKKLIMGKTMALRSNARSSSKARFLTKSQKTRRRTQETSKFSKKCPV